MSQRVKKPGRPDESQAKRRRRRPTGSDGDEDGTRSSSNSGGNGSLSGGVWTPRHLGDLKVASIYNRNSAEAPAELYRKDLISAMKLPDSEPLMPEEYWLITDPWKQEWERGVQVPVNPESLPESQVVLISPVADRSHDFRLPKKKYVRVTHDDFFNPDYHQLVSTAARAEKVCSYDLDDVDAAWLGCANSDRVMQTLPVISEFLMEQVIEELELQCWEQVQTILKSQEGLGIEFDENVICDVCRSPESEEGNEMVFCDSCNICVHQACYGITSIPSGSFLCRTCTLGIRPSCILCPNMGGAMKATRSGHKWAHVACAIWIPEVSIGSVEKMEPITKISAVPQSRWSLICVICKEKGGACIQCSVKTCKTAYHVTCAFKNGLEMKPIIVDENAEDGIKLRSYCEKHSVNTKKEKTAHSGSEDDVEKKRSRAMTAEERNQARAEKYEEETYAIKYATMLQQIEAEFFKYVRLKDVSQNLAVDMDIVNLIYNYWKLKRKSLNNRPLVPPRPETTQLLTQQQEQDLEQMKLFVQLRQDLERVRNLCYMVSRREKLSRSYFRLREQAFQKQVILLTDKSVEGISAPERAAIVDANHGPSIYDHIYSQNGTKSNYKDFESLITLLGGDARPELLNGLVKSKPAAKSGTKGRENPYKKTFVNGARRRSESMSSLTETEEVNVKGGRAEKSKSVRKPLAYLFDTDSSMDAVIISNSTKTKALPRKNVKKGPVKVTTSESELDMVSASVSKSKGKANTKQPAIYSDTESDTISKPILPKKLTSSSSPLVTKGALKEFSKKSKHQLALPPASIPISKSTIRVSPLLSRGEDNPPIPVPPPVTAKKRGRIPGKKRKPETIEPTELIVPQREAAKKASESIRSVKPVKGKEQEGGTESPTCSTTASAQLTKEAKVETVKDSVDKVNRRKSCTADVNSRRKSVDQKAAKVNRRVTVAEVEAIVRTETKLEKRSGAVRLSDTEEDAAGSVSIVPQRQAAKKAAEHIRSCQSNVVAARLIIEDEMEASRKKSKIDRINSKTVKSPTRGRQPSISVPLVSQAGSDLVPTDAVDRRISVGKGPSAVDKVQRKGSPPPPGSFKLGRKGSGIKSPAKEESKFVGWPFLDKGSQSACRRSRERSSSSSSTTSGSSSSTGGSSSYSSSSSSRSSSPGSASPVRPKPPSPHQAPALLFLSTSSSLGPGKKLKTSDRLPKNGRECETSKTTSPRSKPTPAKTTGPPEVGPRRGSATSLVRSSLSPRSRDPSFPENRKSMEEKVGGYKPKSDDFKEEKSDIQITTATKTPPKVSLVRDELALSSDSEEESKKKVETPIGRRSSTQSRSSSVTIISPELKNRPMPKTKKLQLGLLSEDSGSPDEKENDGNNKPPTITPSPTTPALKAQIPTVPVPQSPLARRSISPKKEMTLVKHLTTVEPEDEPEPKRPRRDSTSSPQSIPWKISLPAQSSQAQNQVPTLSSAATTAASMPKCIFSPVATTPVGSKQVETLDFDTDLYDLARSAAGDWDGSRKDSSSSFVFSHANPAREDNKEESSQATINLVEKLRLQQRQKSCVSTQRIVDEPLEEQISDDTPNPPPESNETESTLHPAFSKESDENICDLKKSPRKTNSAPDLDCEAARMKDEWLQDRFPSEAILIPRNDKVHTEPRQNEDPKYPFQLENMSKQFPLRSQNFHSPLLQTNLTIKEDGKLFQTGKDSIERLFSLQSFDPLGHGLLMEAPAGQNNLVSLTAMNSSPSLPPGINLPPGLTASYSGTVPSQAPLYPSSQPGFLPYPISSTLASVVTSLASGNLPFFLPQGTKLPGPSKLSFSTPLSSTPPAVSANMFSFTHHLVTDQLSTSPNDDSSRRRSTETNPLGAVTAGMPPLSKPPLTSPSRLLASNNAMAAPPPPPQSTVAQIIESVIQASNIHPPNTHSNNLHQGKAGIFGTPINNSELTFPFRVNQCSKALNSPSSGTNLSSNTSPVVSPTLGTKTVTTTLTSTAASLVSVSDFSAILPSKPNENIQQVHRCPPVGTLQILPVVSPKGTRRAKRPATPKMKQEKTLNDEASPTGKAKGERKTSGASPGRGGKGRGAGRGKSKGKNVLVRKDLAGTVYDIDFEEFEDNADDKLDLRSLRGRRKSSDINVCDFTKSESSEDTTPSRNLEKNSPRQKPSQLKVENHEVVAVGATQQPDAGILPPSAPVDMRTYDAAMVELDLFEREAGTIFHDRKCSSAMEFASLLGLGTPLTSAVASAKDFDELDKTLEALTSPKATVPIPITNHHSPHLGKNSSQNTSSNPGGAQGGESSLSSSKDSFTTTMSEDNHSRNQLKVKIKGPFLDANYSTSNSISQPSWQQTSTHHHHETFGGINSTPLNLRRMRKKELLRQYCNQDMNTDGRYTHPAGITGEFPAHAHFHPYGRAVITIPKAVASMEIIPSGKDDYGLEPSDLYPLPTPPPVAVQEKKKRTRGVNREMAALGLIEVPPKERWRDSAGGASASASLSDTNNSRKRFRATTKPNRSTFVPPTLAEQAVESTVTALVKLPQSLTAVKHPTPKLKIKFADFNSASATYTSTSGSVHPEANHTVDKDSKKVKGRPPKKRGLAEVPPPAPPPPPMEELKRQSLMFREKIMKDFADADDECGKGSGGKKKKKSKKSKRDEDSVKIISDGGGPKLILRFGKHRTMAATACETTAPLNNNNIGAKTENVQTVPPVGESSLLEDNLDKSVGGEAGVEQDSGFTGSSEGSGESWTPSNGIKTKFSSKSGGLGTPSSPKLNQRKHEETDLQAPLKHDQSDGILKPNDLCITQAAGMDSSVLKFKPNPLELQSTSSTGSALAAAPSAHSKSSKDDKVMPIRLKLHRCYEGYATTKEVDRENTNPKQSDSCEVR